VGWFVAIKKFTTEAQSKIFFVIASGARQSLYAVLLPTGDCRAPLAMTNNKLFSAPLRDVHVCTNVAGVWIHKSDLCGE